MKTDCLDLPLRSLAGGTTGSTSMCYIVVVRDKSYVRGHPSNITGPELQGTQDTLDTKLPIHLDGM